MDEGMVLKMVAAILAAGMLANGQRKGEEEAVKLFDDLYARLIHDKPDEKHAASQRGDFHTPWR